MTDLSFAALRGEYATLWKSMEILSSKADAIDLVAKRCLDAKGGRYAAVEKATGVPWWVVSVIHQMECGGRFDQFLHNGDKLANGRTTHVPKGRPVAPPANGNGYTWVEGAIDAVKCDGLDKVTTWSIEQFLFWLERYNGEGYREYHPNCLNPYLWSDTNHYSRGKYESDGHFDGSIVSGQPGAAPILKRLMELDGTVSPTLESEAEVAHINSPSDIAEQVADPADAFPKAQQNVPSRVRMAAKSQSAWAALIGVCTYIGQKLDAAFNLLPEINETAASLLDPLHSLGGYLKLNLEFATAAIVIWAFFKVVLRHPGDKQELAILKGGKS